MARYGAIEGNRDHGLFGGEVTAAHGGATLRLSRDQLVPGVEVSGTVALSPASEPLDGQSALAALTVRAPGMPAASFTATWTTQGAGASAQVSGSVGTEAVAGSTPAP